MKRLKSLKWAFLLAFAFSVLGGVCGVYADSAHYYYADLFSDNKFVIHTDTRDSLDDFGDKNSFMEYVSSFLSTQHTLYWNSDDDWALEYISLIDCDFDSKICRFDVMGQNSNEPEAGRIQTYHNIAIVIDSDIDDYFPMVDGDNLVIDYDESMFSSDEEKENFIIGYASSYNNASTEYTLPDYYLENHRVRCVKKIKDGVSIIIDKYIDGIVFGEGAYSDEFAAFSNGSLVIKVDRPETEIDEDYLDYSFLPAADGFFRDSAIRDNKVVIRLTKWGDDGYRIYNERHLITLSKTSNLEIYADEPLDYYDDQFANGKFILRTDVRSSLDGIEDLKGYVENYNGLRSHQVYYNSDDDWASLSITINDCDSNSNTCQFILWRYGSDGSSEIIKYFDDIKIVIDSDITERFPMVNGDVLTLNYDDSVFSSEEQKNNYISIYLNNNYGSESIHYGFRYDSEEKQYVMHREEQIADDIYEYSDKRLDNVVFSYVEGSFSEGFKVLTDGILKIKTDTEIDKSILEAVLPYGFYRDSDINNGKVFIRLTKWDNNGNIESNERHLITLVRDSDIDMEDFAAAGFDRDVNIPADEPSNNKEDYINSYLNLFYYYKQYDDGSYSSFSIRSYFDGCYYYHYYNDQYYDYCNVNPNYSLAVLTRRDNLGNIIDTQIRKIGVKFVGYQNERSDLYEAAVGDEVTINADYLDLYTINSSITSTSVTGGYLRVLGCSDDYAYCDIALYSYEDNSVEIHKVKMSLNDVISDEFKAAFNINDDNTITILVGDDVASGYGLSAYYWDQTTNNSLSFDCYDSSKCTLRLSNYKTGANESHDIERKEVKANPSSYFSSLVKDSAEVYPGETENIWNSLSWNSEVFRKTDDYLDNDIRTQQCDSSQKKCLVALVTPDGQLEMHYSKVELKDGVSPEFSALAPNNKVSISAVYKDDEYYIYDMFTAYIMSKAKRYGYLTDINGKKAKFVLGIESHTIDLEFVEADPEKQAAIDDAIEKIGKKSFKSYIEDLEFVNYFFYYGRSHSISNNYNSASIKRDFDKLVDNKHISYYLIEQGGLGDRFMEEWGGGMQLYYDGVGYSSGYDLGYTTTKRNAIYISDDTPDTAEAYVAAAQKRINDYFGEDSGIVVSYLEKAENGAEKWLKDYFDLTGFDGNYYRITHKDKEEDVLILKNSSKMQDSIFFASDVNNNVDVSSGNANYPSDTVVSSDDNEEILEKYKAVIEKLGLKVAKAIDISLYSPTIGDITNFDGVDFNVSVPIGSEYAGKKLFAFFISDDGQVEMHPVTMDDFIAIFGADHFSTYIIAEVDEATVIPEEDEEASSETNPSTYDNIAAWIVICSANAIGLVGAVVYLNKNR